MMSWWPAGRVTEHQSPSGPTVCQVPGFLPGPEPCQIRVRPAPTQVFGAYRLRKGHQALPRKESKPSMSSHSHPPCEKLMEFLGMLNFYKRFIPGAATLLSPLYDSHGRSLDKSFATEIGRMDRVQDPGFPGSKGQTQLGSRSWPTLCWMHSWHLRPTPPTLRLRAVLEQKVAGSWRPLGFYNSLFKPTRVEKKQTPPIGRCHSIAPRNGSCWLHTGPSNTSNTNWKVGVSRFLRNTSPNQDEIRKGRPDPTKIRFKRLGG